MAEVPLTSQEVTDLVLSILEAVDSVEDGTQLRADWPAEMRDWCDLLLTRLYDPEGGTDT